MNRFSTLLQRSALTGLLLCDGQSRAGRGGLPVALPVSGVMNLGAYWFSERFVSRIQGARELGTGDAPELPSIVQDPGRGASLPLWKLYLLRNDSPNASATGRNPHHAAAAVSARPFSPLNRQEIAAVAAHERCHLSTRTDYARCLHFRKPSQNPTPAVGAHGRKDEP